MVIQAIVIPHQIDGLPFLTVKANGDSPDTGRTEYFRCGNGLTETIPVGYIMKDPVVFPGLVTFPSVSAHILPVIEKADGPSAYASPGPAAAQHH